MWRQTWTWVGICLITLGCGDQHEPTTTATVTRGVFDSRNSQYRPGDHAVVAGTLMTALVSEEGGHLRGCVPLRPGVEVLIVYDPGEEENKPDPEGDPDGKGQRFVEVTLVTGPDAGRSGKVLRCYLRPVSFWKGRHRAPGGTGGMSLGSPHASDTAHIHIARSSRRGH